MTSIVDIYPTDTAAEAKKKFGIAVCVVVLHGEISQSVFDAIPSKKSKSLELVETVPKNFVMQILGVSHKFSSITIHIPDIGKCVLDFGHRASSGIVCFASKTPVAIKLMNAPLLVRVTIKSAITLCIENCISLLDVESTSEYARAYLIGTNSIRRIRVIGVYELVDTRNENVSNQLHTFPFYKCTSFKSINICSLPRYGACADYEFITFDKGYFSEKYDYSSMAPIENIKTLRVNRQEIILPHISNVDLLILPYVATRVSLAGIDRINKIQVLLNTRSNAVGWRDTIRYTISLEELIPIFEKCQDVSITFMDGTKTEVPIPFEEFMADYEEKYGSAPHAKSARKI